MTNMEIRNMLFKNNIKHYALAEYLNVSACTMSRWLRTELPTEKKKEILDAIEKLVKETF